MRFTLLRSRQIFSGRVFELEEQGWRGPDGHVFNRQTIVHPGAVGIVPFVTKDQIMLIRQFRPATGKTLLEIPAGTIERGERHLACARRELTEEIGFAAKQWKRLGAIYTAPGFCTEKIVLYKAWDLRPKEGEQDEDEHIAPVVMSRREIKAAVKSGRICDAKTMGALLFLEWLG